MRVTVHIPESVNNEIRRAAEKEKKLVSSFIRICQNTPQLCWGDEWPTLSPGGRGLG
jgi:mRNA-degrading endonuclease RelE of RelBE toxin-antitoxin system